MNITIFTNEPKITTSFLIIFFVGLGIRFYYFPFDLPLIIDGMDNFTYATAINYHNSLPLEWSPPVNGWPIFVSFWFSLINLDNSFEYMQLQRTISVILSSLIIIPIYFLCKKFFDKKIALIGVALFAFDPRIILNSLLGITEPLFILLSISSLVLFLRYDNKTIFLSFLLVSFATIVRSEGIFLFSVLTILFFIKFRFSKNILKTYLPSILLFFLILSPIMMYKMEVHGNDGLFQRASSESVRILSNSSNDSLEEIFNGGELFVTYLGWIMIPNFLIFVPFGIIQFFKNRNKDTNFIIISLIITSIPILYAYVSQAQDTRYLYVLYPIFCLISLFSVKTYISKFSRKNILLSIMIFGIFLSSVIFYEMKNPDREKEIEFNEIGKTISPFVSGLNYHPDITHYIRSSEIPTYWPFLFNDDNYKLKIISSSKYSNLNDFIINSENELTHLLVNDNIELPKFLREIFNDEKKYEYLNKIYDSKEEGFEQHVMLFEINFEKFEP